MLFLTDIIDEMYEFDRVEDMKALYDSIFDEDGDLCTKSYKTVMDWANEMLDMADIPQGCFRRIYLDGVDAWKLIKYIQEHCNPEVQQKCS